MRNGKKRQTKKPRNLQKKNGKNGRREDGKNRESGKDIFPKMWKEAKIKNSYKRFLEKKGIRLYTSDVTRWKEKSLPAGKCTGWQR